MPNRLIASGRVHWLLRAGIAMSVLLLGITLALKFFGRHVNDANFGRIENGMTLLEVEQFFGRSADDAAFVDTITAQGETLGSHKYKIWHSGKLDYLVATSQAEDDLQRVTRKLRRTALPPDDECLQDTLQRWLGLTKSTQPQPPLIGDAH